MKAMNENYHFVIVLSGVDTISSELEDSLFESGCDDALIASRNSVVYLVFDRIASSFIDAISSAIMNIRSSKLKIGISHIEPSDIVSLSEIARRVNRTRESIRLLAKGDRGDGSFPLPISGVDESKQLWSWIEVANWFLEKDMLSESDFDNALIIRTINDKLTELDQTCESIIYSAALPMQARAYLREYTNTSLIRGHTDCFKSTVSIPLQNEFTFFLEKQNEFVENFAGEYLIIHNRRLINKFRTAKEAYQYGASKFTPGTFLIQKCEPGPLAYSKACVSTVRYTKGLEEEFAETH